MIAVLRRLGFALGLPAVVFTLWWLTSADTSNFFFPPLSQIVDRLVDQWFGPRLAADVLPSVLRLAAGYLIAATVGITVGMLVGTYALLRNLLEPVMEFFRAIPPPVIVPILMLVFGIENTMKIVVIAFGCVWPILLNTVEGVRAVDDVLSDSARVYRITGAARLRHLTLPAAGPQIFAGLRQGLSVAIILMVISELFAASDGLGYAVVQAQRRFALPEMWAGMLMLGLLGFLLSLLFRLVENHWLAWYHGMRRAQRS